MEFTVSLPAQVSGGLLISAGLNFDGLATSPKTDGTVKASYSRQVKNGIRCMVYGFFGQRIFTI